MSLDAPPESLPAPSTPGNLEVVQHLLTEALRTLQATNQSAPAQSANPKSTPAASALKPSRPAVGRASPEVRARAAELRRKLLLEPCEPVPPLTPEELAAPVARGFSDPLAGATNDTLPLPVRAAFEELAFALRSLSAAERGAALDYIAAELPKRTAG